MKGPHHDQICEWLQLDPAHYEHTVIEPGNNLSTRRIHFLDGSVSDWFFTFDEDGTVLDGYCFQDII